MRWPEGDHFIEVPLYCNANLLHSCGKIVLIHTVMCANDFLCITNNCINYYECKTLWLTQGESNQVNWVKRSHCYIYNIQQHSVWPWLKPWYRQPKEKMPQCSTHTHTHTGASCASSSLTKVNELCVVQPLIWGRGAGIRRDTQRITPRLRESRGG